ncbi:MAG: DsrE family protein [Halodesulfurarchaeum sp.]|nr:DsrE family protein [Halodesulfurarchaeum sp.]
MAKTAIVILAGTEGHDNLGRLVNGLITARESVETDGDEVKLIFDGAGTQWIPELEEPESDHFDLFRAVKDHASACDFCSSAFGVDEAVDESEIPRLDEYGGHPSLRSLVEEGYEVLTF